MIAELHDNLYTAGVAHPDIRIPGLHGDNLASLILWHDNAKTAPTTNDTPRPRSLLSDLAMVYKRSATTFLSEPGAVGWLCTLVMFPTHWEAFVEAKWLPPSYRFLKPAVWTDQIVWTALPDQNSADGEAFWNVPLDPVFTNMLVLQSAILNPMPPNFQVKAYPGHWSTFLLWPWIQQQREQEEWLGRVENSLRVFACGMDRCSVGVQIVSQTSDLPLLNSLATAHEI